MPTSCNHPGDSRADAAAVGAGAVRFHSAQADQWEARYGKGGFRRRSRFFVDHILPHLTPRGRWLDVGCGSGHFAWLLAARGADVEGIDGSQAMIRTAEKISAVEPGPRPVFRAVESVERLDYPTASCDGVICLSVLEYLARPDLCLQELARVLRRGGQLVVSVPNRNSLLRRVQRFRSRVPLSSSARYLAVSIGSWRVDEFVVLAEAAGLRDITVFEFSASRYLSALRVVPCDLLFMVARKA